MNGTSPSRPRALVAEDDRPLADIIRHALEQAGFDVTTAFNGTEALQLAQATPFQLITCDYQMPGTDGEQFLTQVRAIGPSRDALLILCSAKTYELSFEHLRTDLGVAAIFYKPFSLKELLAVVRNMRPELVAYA